MSDPVQDFEYARNAVTLTFDLSGFEHVRLSFKALEYGDEPHAPPPGPFGDDANFDGVAVSADGVNWYEIQDLRSLTEGQGQPSANSSFNMILSNNCRLNTPCFAKLHPV